MVKILICNCQHQYQDAKYGPNKRLHNWGEKKRIWRCSVCGTEKGSA